MNIWWIPRCFQEILHFLATRAFIIQPSDAGRSSMNKSSSLMYKCPFKTAEADKDTRNRAVFAEEVYGLLTTKPLEITQ